MLFNVENSLTRAKEAIEKEELMHSSPKTFHTNQVGRLPNGILLEGVAITLGREVTFSFVPTK